MGENLYIIENTGSSTSKIFRQPYISKPLHKFIGCNINAVAEVCLVVQPSPSHQRGTSRVRSPFLLQCIYPDSQSLTVTPSAVLLDIISE